MKNRIVDKIREIRQYSGELDSILPQKYEEYAYNFEKRAACERYLEKIVEAIVDLAFLYIKHEGLETPEDDGEAFDILASADVISEALAEKLKHAKGMRNVIAHRYGGVDDKLVFHALTEELGKDVEEFTKKIRKAL